MNLDLIDEYRDGKKINEIAEDYGLTNEGVIEELLSYKDSEFSKPRYSDDFKAFVAERVSYGYTKTEVSNDLSLAKNTVSKFCKEFDSDESINSVEEKLYTPLDVEYIKGQCPECKSKHFNHVDWNSYYCFDCGNEYKIVANTVQKLNFEFL